MQKNENKQQPGVIGIDIGGTKISAALFDLGGNLLYKKIRSVVDVKGAEVGKIIGELSHELIAYSATISLSLVGIGICVPGIYNPIQKTVWAPNIPDWTAYPLWNELTDLIDDPDIKITIESDRSCYILGEVWKGKAKGCTDAIFMAVGTGIGAGILSNGKIISGRNGIAGAIGWMALEQPYSNKFDDLGNFEYYASGNGLARSAIELLADSQEINSWLQNIPADQMSSKHVFHAFEKDDAIAIEVIEKAISYWGMATANLVSIFNPQKIILGGGVFGAATKFIDRIFEESKKWAQPISIQEVTFETSSLKGDAGLFGAGYLAIKTLKTQNHDD
jgi:glucokinase